MRGLLLEPRRLTSSGPRILLRRLVYDATLALRVQTSHGRATRSGKNAALHVTKRHVLPHVVRAAGERWIRARGAVVGKERVEEGGRYQRDQCQLTVILRVGTRRCHGLSHVATVVISPSLRPAISQLLRPARVHRQDSHVVHIERLRDRTLRRGADRRGLVSLDAAPLRAMARLGNPRAANHTPSPRRERRAGLSTTAR